MKRARGDDPVIGVDVSVPEAGAEKGVAADVLDITPLGGGREVGRSCILLKFKGKQVLLDCGIHPAHSGVGALPYYDLIDDIAGIDVLLVSHFHLDHIGSLPYLLEHTQFKGRVFMTHPTKVIYKMLMSDFVRVSGSENTDIFDEQDLNRTLDKIEVLHYHQAITVNGITFTAYNAGHVLGAAQFLIEIAGTHVLYTGDYSREEDRHLMSAEVPKTRPEVLIVEATYGVQMHEPQQQRELRFANAIQETVMNGGKVLIPVFALGRAQELMLLLEELWTNSPQLQHIPVYYASQLAKKALTVFSTYITYMNHKIRSAATTRNPFAFEHIKNLTEGQALLSKSEACIVMASPGMLQSGYSRQLLEAWCDDSRNTVMITGYSVEGTMAKMLMNDPQYIECRDGRRMARRCRVENVSFSAHCDFLQTSEFIDLIQPQHIVLVHGEKNQMQRLHDALKRKYKQIEQSAEKKSEKEGANLLVWKPQEIHTPENAVNVEIEFPAQGKVRVVGNLAEMVPGIGHSVRGVIVRRDFEATLMTPEDLPTYTDLVSTQIVSRIALPLNHTLLPQFIAAVVSVWSDVVVEEIISEVDVEAPSLPMLKVCGRVTVTPHKAAPEKAKEEKPMDPRLRRRKQKEEVKVEEKSEHEYDCIVLEWTCGTVDDIIADSIAAIACQCCIGPWALLQSTEPHSHSDGSHRFAEDALDAVFHTLVGHYGKEDVVMEKDKSISVRMNTSIVFEDEEWRVMGEEKENVMKMIQKLIELNVIAPIKSDIK